MSHLGSLSMGTGSPSFSMKLVLWKTQLSQTNLCHFPACKTLVDEGTTFIGEKYVDVILKLQEEFDHRFADFKTHRATFQIVGNADLT